MSQLSAFLFLLAIALSSFTGFSQEGGPIPPINISFDLDKLKQLDFGLDSLSAEKVLFQLFPAPMNADDSELSEWRTSAYWTCISCMKSEFMSYEDEDISEKETLPFDDANYTSCTNILYYQSDKGSVRAIVSFSTSQINDGTGRFTPGLLSLANFEKQNGIWKLLIFNPFVNYQGSFTMASPVDEVMIGKDGKSYFLIHGGEANGISVEDYWPLFQGLYVVDGETLNEILHIQGANCEENGPEIGSNWKTEITKIEQSSLGGTVIEARSAGLIVKEYNWDLPEAFRFVYKADFDLLPARFNFTASQEFFRIVTELRFEKPLITIQYMDSKGTVHEQIVITQNTCVK